MPILNFGDYHPDVSDYSGQYSANVSNVVPRADGYGPFPNLVAYTGAMADVCRGMFYARKNDGTVRVFAGTSVRLYSFNVTTGFWDIVCSGDYPTLPTTGQWQFAQFNNFVIAVQANCPPQYFDLTSSSTFTDLGGSPPQAAYVSIVNRFLVLSGIAAPNAYRVQWSGLNATTTWASGVNQSDYQDFADGGVTRGVAGGEYGVIFQDSCIRKMTYSPGSSYVFGIQRIAADDGLFAPYSLISAQYRTFWLSPSGFKMLLPSGYPTSIGKEKVDRTFFADVDINNIQMIIGATDPRTTRVYWAYKSKGGNAGQFDKILIYDWALERFTLINVSGEYIASLAQPGTTLEGLDAAYGSNVDTMTLATFDDISTSAYATLAGVDTSHRLGFFSGPNLEATLRTPEQGGDGRRLFIRGFRPVTDATTVYGSVTYRDTAQASPSTTTETLVNAVGICTQRISTRYARGIVRMPAATTWTYATGIEPDVDGEGKR